MSIRELFFVIILLFFLISVSLVSSTFCCQTAKGSEEFKCYDSGICCKINTYDEHGVLMEYWHQIGCFDFRTWIEPSNMIFTVGKNTPINLYVNNLEEYSDRYNISYSIESSNPALISVDMSAVTPTDSVGPDQITELHPIIAVLSAKVSGKVWFNITSWGDTSVYKNTSLTILSSDMPVSLPEFNNSLFLMTVIILTGLTYYFSKLKNSD